MKRITTVILCQLVLFCSFAVELSDTIKSVQIFQEMNKLFNQLGQEFPEDKVIAEVYEFEVPAELIDILPGRSRMIIL